MLDISHTSQLGGPVKVVAVEKREYSNAPLARWSWLYSLVTSELQAYGLTPLLSIISTSNPIWFSPFARVRFKPDIVGSTTSHTPLSRGSSA